MHVNDSGYILLFDVTDVNGVINLTNVLGVDLILQKPDQSIITRACQVVDAPNGVVQYITTNTDFDQAGKWKLQIVVRFSLNNIKHADVDTVKILKNIS